MKDNCFKLYLLKSYGNVNVIPLFDVINRTNIILQEYEEPRKEFRTSIRIKKRIYLVVC